jgi:quercetin dioxygenase-like cupin family protein
MKIAEATPTVTSESKTCGNVRNAIDALTNATPPAAAAIVYLEISFVFVGGSFYISIDIGRCRTGDDSVGSANGFGSTSRADRTVRSSMPAITNLEALEATPHAEVFEERSPRTVRLQLDAGDRIPPHRHPESTIVLHLLRGELELSLGGEVYTIEPDDFVRFRGDQEISPSAVEDSEAVLVFVPVTE